MLGVPLGVPEVLGVEEGVPGAGVAVAAALPLGAPAVALTVYEALLLTLTEELDEAEGDRELLELEELERVALTEPDAEALADTEGLALLLTEPLKELLLLALLLTLAEELVDTEGLSVLFPLPVEEGDTL